MYGPSGERAQILMGVLISSLVFRFRVPVRVWQATEIACRAVCPGSRVRTPLHDTLRQYSVGVISCKLEWALPLTADAQFSNACLPRSCVSWLARYYVDPTWPVVQSGKILKFVVVSQAQML